MSPGGTRLKVFESMASDLPVVSTPIGVAGLKIENGVQAMVASEPEVLADMAVRVLMDKNLAKRLAEEGKKYVLKNFSWESIVDDLNKEYSQLVSQK